MDKNNNKEPTYLIPGQIRRILQNMTSTYGYQLSFDVKAPNTYYLTFVNKTSEQIYNTYDKIFKALASYHYPNSIFTPGADSSDYAKYKTILVNTNKDISIKFFVGINEKIPKVLRPGMAFEDYFFYIVKEHITELKNVQKELGTPLIPLHVFNLSLELSYGVNKLYKIDKIVGVEYIGRANKKPDIQINCRAKPNVKISLKQGNFGNWSQANTYTGALEILKKNIDKGVVELNRPRSGIVSFKKNINGFYLQATLDEVNKYCYGTTPHVVDYIVINAHLQGIDEQRVIHVNSDRVYANNINDMRLLMSDVYLLISEDPNSNPTALPGYRGLRIQFVNSEVIQSKGKYIQGIR